MKQSILHVALAAPDYDEALAYFMGLLTFTLGEDAAVRSR